MTHQHQHHHKLPAHHGVMRGDYRAVGILALLIAIAVILSLMGCKNPLPVDPDPIPSPSPSPTPDPQYPPAPHFQIRGTSFVPPVLGLSTCCDDPDTPGYDEGYAAGWPLAIERWLAGVRSLSNRTNLIHMRSGPYRDELAAVKRYSRATGLLPTRLNMHLSDTEDDIVRLNEAVRNANFYGFAVEVDVIDGWALRHGVTIWRDGCEVTRTKPKERHIEWAKAVARAVSRYAVTYQIGNELSLCRPSEEWVEGIRDAIRTVDDQHPIGSDAFPELVDYETYHSHLGNVRPPDDRPLLHNESDNERYTASQYLRFIEQMTEAGSYVSVWFGPMARAEREAYLQAVE